MGKSRKKLTEQDEAPVDLTVGDSEEDEASDVYELRFCTNPSCGLPLPVDAPGRWVEHFGERILVCRTCSESEW